MKFIKDIILNIVSQGLFIAVLQLILFPNFEKQLGSNEFGNFIFIYGIYNVLSVTLATSFTNHYQRDFHKFHSELNTNNEYYNFIKNIIYYGLFMYFITFVCILIFHLDSIYLLIVTLTLLTALRMFLIIKYRVRKKFEVVVGFNILISIIYSSLIVINIESVFAIILNFVIVEIIINVLIIIISKTKVFNIFSNHEFPLLSYYSINVLMLTGLTGSIMNYSDRFIIKLLLDSTNVTTFYIATLPTKILIAPFTFISSVIMSYLSNTKYISKSTKKIVFILIPLIFILITLVSYFGGLYVISILYPEYIGEIKSIYLLVTLTFGFICIDFILRSFILKYFSLLKKAILDLFILILFIVMSYILYSLHDDLLSIAIAQMFTFIIKMIIQLIIFNNLKEEGVDSKC